MGLLAGVGDFGLTGILENATAANSAASAANTAATNTLNAATTYQQQIVDVLKLKQPTTAKKKILVIGSSVAAGVNVTYAESYVGRLASALSATHDVVQIAMGGSSTPYWITDLVSGKSRLENAIIQYRPDYVLIGLSLGNEGITSSNKEAIFTQFWENVQRMVALVRNNGAVPVVMGAYPRSDYTSVEYNYYRAMNRITGNSDFLFVNFNDVLDDGTGKLVAAIDSGDGMHPNATGHQRIFDTIPLDYFRRPAVRTVPLGQNRGLGLKPKDATYGTVVKFAQIQTGNYSSFTFQIDAKANISGVNGKAIASFSPTVVRIRVSAGVAYVATSSALTAINLGALLLDQYVTLTVKYNQTTNTLYGYRNGVLQGTYVVSDMTLSSFSGVELGNNGTSVGIAECSLRNALFYQTAMSDAFIEELSKGAVPAQNLVAFLPMTDTGSLVANSRLLNLAPTNVQAVVGVDLETAKADAIVTEALTLNSVDLSLVSKTINVTYNGGAWVTLAKIGVDIPFTKGTYVLQVDFSTTAVSGGNVYAYTAAMVITVSGVTNSLDNTMTQTVNAHALSMNGRTVAWRWRLGSNADPGSYLEFNVTGDTTPTPGAMPVSFKYRRLI